MSKRHRKYPRPGVETPSMQHRPPPGQMITHAPLALQMADLARATALGDVDDVLAEVTASAQALIPGADDASVVLVDEDGLAQTLASTSPVSCAVTELQMATGEGPSLLVMLEDTMVRVDDFRTDPRFPRYGPEVVTRGVLSALSFRLYTPECTAGALTLVGFQPHPWDAEADTVGNVLAAHAAAAISASRRGDQLKAAISTRDHIGQATGILMERFSLDDVAALAMLRRLSQDTNTTLIATAQQVIATR